MVLFLQSLLSSCVVDELGQYSHVSQDDSAAGQIVIQSVKDFHASTG